MKQTLFIILFTLLSGSLSASGIDLQLLQKNKLALAQEAEALRRQSVQSTPEGRLIVDSAKLRQSTTNLLQYTKQNKKAETKYWLLLAENYFDLQQLDKAKAIYQSHLSDGLSQLRLGEIIYRNRTNREHIHKAVYYLVNGMSIASTNTTDYTQAAVLASQILPMCYYEMGDDDNARRYHRLYTHESEAEANMWLYHLYWKANQYEHALQCARTAAQLEPNNPTICELIGGYYFNEQKHDIAFPYWQQAANAGSAIGHVRLGQAYYNANGCTKNDSLAIIHLEEGLKTLNWSWAQKLLAQIYMQEDSTASSLFNIERAHYWLEKAITKGDWNAKASLAESLAHWGRLQSDPNARQRMLHQANRLAIEILGNNRKSYTAWQVLASFVGDSLLSQPKIDLKTLKQKRKFLAINFERDWQICQLLADGGYIDEIIQLGKAYTTGTYEYSDYLAHHKQSVDTSYTTALAYFRRGLEVAPDNVICITAITDAYTFGRGTDVDIFQAKKFWEAHGMFGYSTTYFYPWRTYKIQNGDIDEVIYMFNYYDPARLNMPVDESLKWLKNAANNGNKEQRATALFLLGGVYENGQIAPQDQEAAVAYYKQSASLDNGNANHRLGEIYKDGGCGVNRNLETAAKYYRRSYQLTNNQNDYWEFMNCNNAGY